MESTRRSCVRCGSTLDIVGRCLNCARNNNPVSEWKSKPDKGSLLRHKLLFFGPSVADDRTTKEMKRTGTIPEDKMDDCINRLMQEGWRVTFRHYDPSFHVQQWRVILERS